MMKKIASLILVLSICCPLRGQEGVGQPTGIFDTQQEYNEFMGTAKQLAYGPDGTDEMKAVIPLLNDIALGRPVGWTSGRYGGEKNSLEILSDPNVRAELEMVDDQYKALQELNRDLQERIADRIRNIDFGSDSWISEIQAVKEMANSELNEMLLPHQLQRLKEILIQTQLRRVSLVEILTSDPVKSELGITDPQSKELRESADQIQKELDEAISELRKKAQNRLLSRLSLEQQRKAKQLIGKDFSFDSSQHPGRLK